MAKKSINVFSLSFLDLLSGALGAVLILYIIIPKLSIPVEQFEEQARIAEEIGKIGVALEDIEGLVPGDVIEDIQHSLEVVTAANDSLRLKVRDQAQALAECETDKKGLQEQVENLNDQVQDLTTKLQTCEAQLSQCKADLANCPPPCPVCPTEELTGFVLSRYVLFVIDVSGSMKDDNKLNEVKAGIKMLVATMNDGYYVDVAFYPNQAGGTAFGARYGNLQPVTEARKYELYQFIADLQPDGRTPTEDALRAALNNYPRAETIVLLSDGAPTDLAGNVADPAALVQAITGLNNGRAVINTIGVGSEFRQQGASAVKDFLEQLAVRNGGFYVGF